MRLLAWVLVLGLALSAGQLAAPAKAEAQSILSANAGRVHTYKLLRRDPWKAVGWDVLLPGAGSVYVGLYGNTIASALASLAGAALWIHGGVRNQDNTYWTGVALFAAGRSYGIASAGIGAAMLNRALRRQLSIGLGPLGLRLRF